MVECAPGEQLALPPQLAHSPAAGAMLAAAVPAVELWCNDNSLGTFFASTAAVPFPERSFDLRSPLGVTPAALLAMGAAEEVAWAAPKQQPAEQAAGAAADPGRPQDVQQPAAQQAQLGKVASLRKQQGPGEMFRRFESSRRHLQTETAARLVTPSGGVGAMRCRQVVCMPLFVDVIMCSPGTLVPLFPPRPPAPACSRGLPPRVGLGRQRRRQRPRHLHLAPAAPARLRVSG